MVGHLPIAAPPRADPLRKTHVGLEGHDRGSWSHEFPLQDALPVICRNVDQQGIQVNPTFTRRAMRHA
jgi:hypothetical protein